MAKLGCFITGTLCALGLLTVPVIGPALAVVAVLSFLLFGMIPAAIIDARAKRQEREDDWHMEMLGHVSQRPARIINIDARSVHTHNNIWMEEAADFPSEAENIKRTRMGRSKS
jgi:hypothetical protein